MTRALEAVPGKARLLVETTAGQGTCLGWRFEQVAAHPGRRPGSAARRRTGVCVDTCHVFAAGYDITTEDGYERTIAELDRVVGLAQRPRVPPQRLEEAARVPGRPARAHRRGRAWGSPRSAAW